MKLTTGPFRIPAISNNTASVDLLIIGLKNHSNKQRTVTVTVDRCPEAVFPMMTSEESTIFTDDVTLEPNECTQIQIFEGTFPDILFSAGDLIRVSFEGGINKKAKKMEVTVVGRDNVGGHEATTFFRHENLIRVKD